MKKILLTVAMGLTALWSFAQTTVYYMDDLLVTVDDEVNPAQETQIAVTTNADGTYTLALNNFCMYDSDGDVIYIGNINIPNIKGTTADGVTTFSVNDTIQITAGDLEDATIFWAGPSLGDVPIILDAKMTSTKFYCVIDIDMTADLGQIIHVQFGTDNFTSAISATMMDADEVVTVYDLLGVAVKKNVARSEALDGLRKGIYIVGGKKMIKK